MCDDKPSPPPPAIIPQDAQKTTSEPSNMIPPAREKDIEVRPETTKYPQRIQESQNPPPDTIYLGE